MVWAQEFAHPVCWVIDKFVTMPLGIWAIWLGIILEPTRHDALELPWFFTTSSASSTSSEENGTVSEGDYVSGDPPQSEEGWDDSSASFNFDGITHIWGYLVLHFNLRSWIGPSWFSTHSTPGILSSSGGWGLYLVDRLGLMACGDFWPWVAKFCLGCLMLGMGCTTLYLLVMIGKPFHAFCTCCCRQTRAVAREVGEFLPELNVGGTYEKLDLRGPSSGGGVDSEFYQRGVKGRGSERKPNDVAVLLQDQIARLKVDGDHWARVDRHGLWVRLREVKGASSKQLRQRLEQEGRIHLCREYACPLEQQPTPGLHCKSYAAVDANSLVDLGAYAGWSTRRMAILVGRRLRRLWILLLCFLYYTSGCFIMQLLLRKRSVARTITEGTIVRPLDPESESEAEMQEDPCEAVLVGLEHGGKPRALAPDPCHDKAAGESVRLLERDRELSDVRRRASVRLCDHHRQLYIAACSGRKCSVLSCYEQVDGAKQGVPLCKQHLLDVGPGVRPQRRVSWTSDRVESKTRSEASSSEAECRTPERKGAKRRSASAGPRSDSQSALEGKMEQGPCMVLLRPRSIQRADCSPRWVACLGRVEGVAAESRAQELLLISIPRIQRTCAIRAERIIDTPSDNGSGRISKNWVATFLKHRHDEAVSLGLSILACRLTEDQATSLHAWDGKVTDDGPGMPQGWHGSISREILPHAEAYLHEDTDAPDDFMTPPRPKGEEVSRPMPPLPEFPDFSTENDLKERIAAAKDTLARHPTKESDAMVVQTIAAAFELEPEQLMAGNAGTGGGKRKTVELDPSCLAEPPELEEDLQRLPSQGQASFSFQGPGLIIPAKAPIGNPLLEKSSSSNNGGSSLFAKSSRSSHGLIRPAADQLPRIGGRAGATFGETLGESSQVQSADRIIHAIDGLRKAQDEDKNMIKGTLASVKEAEKMDVFLARGCGTLTIEMAPGVYGRELFHAGKRVAQHARHMLQLIKWPVLMTNRLLLGIAGLWWGGRDTYTIHASDCVTARSEQLDVWHPPSDHKAEGRTRAPGVFNTWLRYAENSIKVFGSCYGVEHVQERLDCLQALKEAHEEDEHAFPASYCIDLFEELVAAWCEELRESRRRLCSLLGTENPRLEDLKMLALAPGPDGQANFQFPRIWDLNDPEGYYHTVVVPRQQRQMSRLLHKQLHDHNLRQRKAAGPADDGEDQRAGKAPKLNLKDKEREQATAGGGVKGAYPAGKRLTPAEASRSVEHAPKDPKTSKPICWDAATHMGCSKGQKCQHAHEPLPGLAKMDYTVAMQVIRRGGLKGGKKIDPKEVDGRVAQLRAQATAEKAEKIQPKGKPNSKAKSKAKTEKGEEPAAEEDKAGELQWEAPEDYQGPLTQLETDLQEAVQGPDASWLAMPAQPTEEEAAPAWNDQTSEEQERILRWKRMEKEGALRDLKDPSDYLHAHVVARLMAAEDQGQQITLSQCLEEAAEQGHPALAEEACRHLEHLKFEPKAGHRPDAEFSALNWESGIGHGELQLHGELAALGPIAVRDYQDKLDTNECGIPMTGSRGQWEERQCLPLHVGLGVALAEDPAMELDEARKQAHQLRKALWSEAVEAHTCLGDPPTWIPEGEHFLRQNVHDCLYPHHEKDYRVLQNLAGNFLNGKTLVVLRISYFGRLEVDLLHGGDHLEGQLVFVTIHRGHMRLLFPADPPALLQGLREHGKIIRELGTEDWRETLDQSKQEDQLVPSKGPTCSRCQQQQTRPYRVGDEDHRPPPSFETCLHSDPQALVSPGTPLHQRLAFAYGPVGQEVSAGLGGWTKGLRFQGIACVLRRPRYT